MVTGIIAATGRWKQQTKQNGISAFAGEREGHIILYRWLGGGNGGWACEEGWRGTHDWRLAATGTIAATV